MLAIPPDLAPAYESLLANRGGPMPQRPYFLKWRRYDLDFCQSKVCHPRIGGAMPLSAGNCARRTRRRPVAASPPGHGPLLSGQPYR